MVKNNAKSYSIIWLQISGKKEILATFYNEELAYKKLEEYMRNNPTCIIFMEVNKM
jgi:hypothetical protein